MSFLSFAWLDATKGNDTLAAAGKRPAGYSAADLPQGAQVPPCQSIARRLSCVCYATVWLQLDTGMRSMWACATCILNRLCRWRGKCSQHDDRSLTRSKGMILTGSMHSTHGSG